MKRYWPSVVLGWTVFHSGFLPAQSAPGQSDSLQLAGVAFLSAASSADSLFPFAREVYSRAKAAGTPLDRVLVEAFQGAGLPVQTEGTGRTGYALAFAFDDEYQVVQRFGSVVRVATVLSAQLLTIDFRTQQAVSAMPVTLDHLYLGSTDPDATTREKIVAGLLARFTDAGPTGLFREAAEVFKNLDRPAEGSCRVRLSDVSYDPTVVDATATRFHGDTARLKRVMTSQLARVWMTAARQPLLPNGDYQARGKMQGRFANGEVFNLRIPDPDYELIFSDVDTRRGIAGKNNVIRVEATGLRYTLRVQDAVMAKPVASGTYQLVQLDTLSVNSPPVDGWTAVSNALASLTAGVGVAAKTDDRAWLKANDVDKTSTTTLPSFLRKRCAN